MKRLLALVFVSVAIAAGVASSAGAAPPVGGGGQCRWIPAFDPFGFVYCAPPGGFVF